MHIQMDKIKLNKNRYCKVCGSKLGIDCGDAEPDYSIDLCSFGCYLKFIKPKKTTVLHNVHN
ncbi:MAG: hypothetical protein Tp178DCM178821_32 [Prokaryotic dsDNA virus sp.]|nr:MAG: hypothetical protein Tp178DCM178821_32 [Prokaryotic dsDNA virus sp.]